MSLGLTLLKSDEMSLSESLTVRIFKSSQVIPGIRYPGNDFFALSQCGLQGTFMHMWYSYDTHIQEMWGVIKKACGFLGSRCFAGRPMMKFLISFTFC